MKSVAVFCASRPGTNPVYREAAQYVGKFLADKGFSIIYGGGRVGLMGAVADAALQAGGEVIGVIPYFLDKQELAHKELSELIMVKSMHERKMKMSELSDAVIALPGGFGTLEELTEMLTWSQLALHQKPIGILNINSYYDKMEQLFDQMQAEDFLHSEVRKIAIFDKDIAALLEKMQQFRPGKAGLRLDREKT